MTKSASYLLVEDFDPDFDYRQGKVVSLSPVVSHQLGIRNIPYQIPEDFYDEKELRRGRDRFFLDQLQWIDDFDSLIRKKIQFCQKNAVDLARACYHQLKYFIDSVVVQCWILDRILHKMEDGNEIVYLRRADRGKATIENFTSDDASALYATLLPLLARNREEVRLVLHNFGVEIGRRPVSTHSSHGLGSKSFRKRPKRELFRPLLLFIRYRTFWPKDAYRPLGPRILFLHSGSRHLDIPIRRLFGKVGELFLRVEGDICSLHRASLEGRICLNKALDEEELAIEKECEALFRSLREDEGRSLIDWVSAQGGIDLSTILLPYFQHFLEVTCFKILRLCRQYVSFYKQSNLNFVVSHTNADIDAKSALLAAKVCGVKTVGIQHGCQVFEDRVWEITDIDFFDYYFASDGFSENKFRESVQCYHLKPCRIFQSPHYLEDLQTYVCRGQRGKKEHAKRILYISAKLRVYVRQFNMSSYPATWYFEYQKALVELFSTKLNGYDFVYKHALMKRRYADESIVRYLQEKRFRNIMIETKPIRECLRAAHAVIVDRPTTAFFEALACGLPVLALYPDFVEDLIPLEAKRIFGRSLQVFSTAEEAFDKIEAFLKGDLPEYRKSISLDDDDLLRTLIQEASTLPVSPLSDRFTSLLDKNFG